RLVRDPELRALAAGTRKPCLGAVSVPPAAAARAGGASAPRSPATLAECRLAIETDWQLYQRFNSSALLASYVTGLVAAASEQYFTDVQATLALAYLGIHTNANDGWTTQDSGGGGDELLAEFQAAWGT